MENKLETFASFLTYKIDFKKSDFCTCRYVSSQNTIISFWNTNFQPKTVLGNSILHITIVILSALDFCPRPARKETNVPPNKRS